jgi:C1A family cysteine protease
VKVGSNAQLKSAGATKLPSSVDWRTVEGGKVTPVKDEGSCYANWAFAATALYESFLMIGGMAEPDLSEEYIL